MGGHHLIAKDYGGPDVESEELREKIRRRRSAIVTSWITLFRWRTRTPVQRQLDPEDAFKSNPAVELPALEKDRENSIPTLAITPVRSVPNQHVSFYTGDTVNTALDTSYHMVSPTSSSVIAHTEASAAPLPPLAPESISPTTTAREHKWDRLGHEVLQVLRGLLTPCTVGILAALVIALVTPLKALFTPLPPGTHSPIPNAPDGQPPLAFILDTASFTGGASVPLGLVCLGNALARLKIPRGTEWETVPRGAIIALTLAKMVLMPVLGVLIVKGLVSGGIIDGSNKLLQFVCMCVSFVFAR